MQNNLRIVWNMKWTLGIELQDLLLQYYEKATARVQGILVVSTELSGSRLLNSHIGGEHTGGMDQFGRPLILALL